jgi:hypothetical protein
MTAMHAWLTAMLVVFVVEVVLMARWSRLYYATGVPLFVRRAERPDGLHGVSLEALQQRTRRWNSHFQFRRFGPELIVFRERTAWNFAWPLMFGVIRHDPEAGTVVVSGKMTWYTIPGIVFVALWLPTQPMLFFVPLIVFGFAYAYYWRWRWYGRVAAALAVGAPAPAARVDPHPVQP